MSVEVPWQPSLQLFFEATTQPGISGVGQCALSPHLALRPHGEGTTHWIDATDAVVLWLGFYGNPLLGRGRQPYDQTSPAAYMPLPLSAFEVYPLPAGALLVQRQASRTRLNRSVHDGGGGHHEACLLESAEQARRAVEHFLHAMGVDEVTASTCVEQVLSRLLSGYSRLSPSVPPQAASRSA